METDCIRSQPAEICGSKRLSGAGGSASNQSRPKQATRYAKIKSLHTMRNTIKEKSSPTTATSSGQDISAHVGQSNGDSTATIRPRREANVGPTKAVQALARPIRRPCAPPPGPARHRRVPTATTMGLGLAVVGTPGSPSDVVRTMVHLPRPSGDGVRLIVCPRSVVIYWFTNQRHLQLNNREYRGLRNDQCRLCRIRTLPPPAGARVHEHGEPWAL